MCEPSILGHKIAQISELLDLRTLLTHSFNDQIRGILPIFAIYPVFTGCRFYFAACRKKDGKIVSVSLHSLECHTGIIVATAAVVPVKALRRTTIMPVLPPAFTRTHRSSTSI